MRASHYPFPYMFWSYFLSFFPILPQETRLFWRLFFIILLTSFNYSFLRISKDVLVMTQAGPEILSALKLYCVLPAALIYTIYYSYLVRTLEYKDLFFYSLAPFAVFYALFGLVFFFDVPLHSQVGHDLLVFLGVSTVPAVFKPFIDLLNIWPSALYYVMSELWGSVAMNLIFWTTANSIVSVEQAQRLYPFFGIGANLGLILTGPFIYILNFVSAHHYETVMKFLMLTFIVVFVILLGLYTSTFQNIPLRSDWNLQNPSGTERKKMGWFEAIRLVTRSSHLGLIAILVISYGLSMNLIEILWKSQVVQYFFSPEKDFSLAKTQMQFFSAQTNTMMGLLSLAFVFFFRSYRDPQGKIHGRSWKNLALMTPVILFSIGVVFYGISFANQYKDSSFWGFLGLHLMTDPAYIAILIGAIQNASSKAAKYSLFDPTKERAYFPLSFDEKTKGKSAIDVLGARFGKALGALIQQIVIVSLGSLSIGFYWMGLIVFFTLFVWIFAILRLAPEIDAYEMKSVS